jgi:glycosyltransferase involved in cell wall biosynthesis
MDKILTIAIPTYNRIKHLTRNLPTLLNQLTDECELLIIDNCSDILVENQIIPILECYPNITFKINRNSKNIGLFSNILKCFEESKTKWLYILGDDDQLLPNSVSFILEDLKTNSDCLNITYQWFPEKKWVNTRPKVINGFLEYAKSIESIHHVLFLSSNIYNLQKLSKYIHIGHYFQLTSAPHLVLLLVALDQNHKSKVYLSNKYIVDNLNSEVEEETKWNRFDFFRNNKLLLDLPIHSLNTKALFSLYKKSYPITTYLNFYLQMDNNKLNRLDEFQKAIYYYKIYGSLKDKILIFISYVLLKFPRLTMKLINFF